MSVGFIPRAKPFHSFVWTQTWYFVARCTLQQNNNDESSFADKLTSRITFPPLSAVKTVSLMVGAIMAPLARALNCQNCYKRTITAPPVDEIKARQLIWIMNAWSGRFGVCASRSRGRKEHMFVGTFRRSERADFEEVWTLFCCDIGVPISVRCVLRWGPFCFIPKSWGRLRWPVDDYCLLVAVGAGRHVPNGTGFAWLSTKKRRLIADGRHKRFALLNE